MRTKTTLLAAGVATALAVSACGSSGNGNTTGGSASSSGGMKIGLLLPETKVPRYESKDKPYFTQKLKQICPNCQLLYANANSDAGAQQQQAQSMLAQGVKALVVDPYDGVAAASIVNAAKARNVPVVAYDRLINSPQLSYVISNNYEKVGRLQAQSLVDKLKADGVSPSAGGIVMLNGATTDDNAGNIKKGALSVIDASGYKILASTDTWDPSEAQKFVAGQAAKDKSKIIAVYSANDGNAGGAIAALKAAGVQKLPPITGLDASVEGLQAILAGNQYMTTYNAFRKEADSAAEAAVELARGQQPKATAKVDGIPATLNPPVAVTLHNIESTVIADGFYKASEICGGNFQAACSRAGIK
jgi:D-xylose transport system substrate-binding protein